MVKTPTVYLRAELVLAVIAAVSGVVFGVIAAGQGQYFMLASQALVLVAGVFGVLSGLGRFGSGPALAAACVGGSILTGVVVGGLETNVLPSLRGGGVFRYAVLGQAALAAAFGAIAGLMILSRTPAKSVRLILTAGVVGAPVVLLAAAARLGWVARFESMVPPVVFQVVTLISGLVLIVLISISAHCVIRAFEIGVDAADPAVGGRPAEGTSGTASENG